MTLLEQLDTRTLAFVTGLGGFLMAAAMAGSYWAGMRGRALIDWSLAGVCFFAGYLLGYVLLADLARLPVWFVATLANFVIAFGHVLLLTGVRRYLGRPAHATPLALVTLGLLALTLLVEPIHTSLRARLLVVSTFYVALDLAAGVLLWRAHRPGLTLYHRLTAGVLLGYGAFLGLRIALAAAGVSESAAFSPEALQGLVFLVSMGFIFSLTLAFALVMFRGKEVELQRLVHHDALTGLLNRRTLLARAAAEAARSERYGDPLSLVIVDIDHFKQINDRSGHAAGDEVIRRVATCIGLAVRETDSAFRLGGEEFLVLMPATDLAAATRGAERLRTALAGAPMPGGEGITCSLGVTTLARGQETWDAAMRRADQALYFAKRSGRDRVVALSASQAAVLGVDTGGRPLPLP